MAGATTTTAYRCFRLLDFAAADMNGQFVVQMFAVSELGQTACISVNDFNPFFYVRVPDTWSTTMQQLDVFTKWIMQHPRLHGKMRSTTTRREFDEMVSLSFANFGKLYGFDGGRKYQFVRLEFHTMHMFRLIRSIWIHPETGKLLPCSIGGSGGGSLEIYESSIPPLLRYFHLQDISPSGWVKVPLSRKVGFIDANSSLAALRTTCDCEFHCRRAEVIFLASRETRAPFKICSFDIEASSSHGDFPVPQKTYKRLATNIVDMVHRSRPKSSMVLRPQIRAAIFAAFGFGCVEDIDLVYPKRRPEKREDIDACIERALNFRTSAAATTATAAIAPQMTHTIEGMYMAAAAAASAHDNDDVEDGDDDEDEDGGGDMEDDVEENTRSMPQTSSFSTIATTTMDIVQMLLTPDGAPFSREDKINRLNDALSSPTTALPQLEGDKVTFIGSTFIRYGESQPYLNHCLVVGSCDDVPGAKIDCVEKEEDLLMQWTALIQRENPDIIVGYNIFGFDYEFLFRRAQENNCARSFLMLSRKMNECCGKTEAGGGGTRIESIERNKVKLASGEYELSYVKMTGRFQVDMLNYLRREYNLASYKLDDVAGHFVGDSIVNVEFVADENKTLLYTKNVTGLRAGDFVHLEEIAFTTNYFANGQKFAVMDIDVSPGAAAGAGTKALVIAGRYPELEMLFGKQQQQQKKPSSASASASASAGGQKKSLRWCLAKDDVSPQDIFRMTNEGPSARAVIAKYCIQDCNLVHNLMTKLDVLTSLFEMSRICSVPVSFLVFRGQGIKLTSYVAKKCLEKQTLMPDLEKAEGNEGYEGAIVLPPKCGFYFDNPVACVDYASLYPSLMISENLSHDSKVWTKQFDLNGNLKSASGERDPADASRFLYDNLPGYRYVDITFDAYECFRRHPKAAMEKRKCGTTVCRWAQRIIGAAAAEDTDAIMPSILRELLRARADTRKQAKLEKDPFMQNILDKRQLGYKVTANSLYGQCGARTSTFYEKDVAASTTAMGRRMILYARRVIEEVFGGGVEVDVVAGGGTKVRTNAEYVYGDTDSVFFTFNLSDFATGQPIRGRRALEITIELAQEVARLCSLCLKAPMELAYEKTLMPFALLAKKRYVGMLYETNADAGAGKLKYMGLSLKRRDSCDYLKDVYGAILNQLMSGEPILAVTAYLQKSMVELVEGKVPMEKLLITRSLRSEYKNPQMIAHKVLADRMAQRDPGNRPKPGDRMRFVFIVAPPDNPRALLGERIETPEFVATNPSICKIDYAYYITNQLMKPLQQLFGLAIEDIAGAMKMRSVVARYRNDIENLRKECFMANAAGGAGGGDALETFMKKKEHYCAREVKILLFSKILQRIENERAGVRTIGFCFDNVATATAGAGTGTSSGPAKKKLCFRQPPPLPLPPPPAAPKKTKAAAAVAAKKKK